MELLIIASVYFVVAVILLAFPFDRIDGRKSATRKSSMDFIRKLFRRYKSESIIPGGYSYSTWTDSRGGQWFIVLSPGGTVLAQCYNAEFAAQIVDALNRA